MTDLPSRWHLGKRIGPPRFLILLLVFAGSAAIAIPALEWSCGIMAAFNAGAAMFLLAVAPMLGRGEAAAMRATARANDANRAMLLGITGATLLAIPVAVADELGDHGRTAVAPVLLTLVLAWLFSNTVYALRYAHLYYLPEAGHDAGGLDFPVSPENIAALDYADFL